MWASLDLMTMLSLRRVELLCPRVAWMLPMLQAELLRHGLDLQGVVVDEVRMLLSTTKSGNAGQPSGIS